MTKIKSILFIGFLFPVACAKGFDAQEQASKQERVDNGDIDDDTEYPDTSNVLQTVEISFTSSGSTTRMKHHSGDAVLFTAAPPTSVYGPSIRFEVAGSEAAQAPAQGITLHDAVTSAQIAGGGCQPLFSDPSQTFCMLDVSSNFMQMVSCPNGGIGGLQYYVPRPGEYELRITANNKIKYSRIKFKNPCLGFSLASAHENGSRGIASVNEGSSNMDMSILLWMISGIIAAAALGAFFVWRKSSTKSGI